MATSREPRSPADRRPLWVRGASWLVRSLIVATRSTLGFVRPRVRAFVTLCSDKREWIYAGLERVAWWTALALVALAGTDLFDAFTSNDAFFRAPYLLGAASLLCVAILFRTSAKHIRAGAFMLGTSAGALCLLGWLAQHG